MHRALTRWLTTKIHAVVDANGLPIRPALSPGQDHDSRLATHLLDGLKSHCMLLADRGYDSDAIRQFARARGAWANIPPNETARTLSASARTSIVPAITLSGSSTGSSTAAGSQPDMRSSQPTTSLL